jgi:hypothetical protein
VRACASICPADSNAARNGGGPAGHPRAIARARRDTRLRSRNHLANGRQLSNMFGLDAGAQLGRPAVKAPMPCPTAGGMARREDRRG